MTRACCVNPDHTVFISGLTNDLNASELEQWFQEHVPEISFAHILKNKAQGFARMHFESREMAANVFNHWGGRNPYHYA